MPNYIAYTFVVKPLAPATEILIAELAELGFESFVENETGLIAYIKKAQDNQALVNELFILNNPAFKISKSRQEIVQVNWNKVWEKNFEAIQIQERVSIRAPFHKDPPLEYDIIIEPKMSFGTGHHETTHLMIEHLLELELKDKKVLDMGCGTGILAIFAAMRGASDIDAVDIDPWCVENSIENCKRNKCKHIKVFQGDASFLKTQKYDLIIANINRNILIKDFSKYVQCLNKKGLLLLSGFYSEGIEIIQAEAAKNGLQFLKRLERNNWVALKYIR